MHAVASMNTANIQELADHTDATKKEYCERYGYHWSVLTESDFVLKTEPYSVWMDFNKPHFIMNLFNTQPDIEWLLFTECDATITNLTVPIEDKIDNDYHVVIPVDRLNLNSGNFLIRNSQQGRAYVQAMIDRAVNYEKDQGPGSTLKDKWGIQQFMIDTLDEFVSIIKIVPQRYMNSYQQELYDYCDVRTDILGTSGEWQKGDWIVHWPGVTNSARLAHCKNLPDMIVR
jgi:hypothetical protein